MLKIDKIVKIVDYPSRKKGFISKIDSCPTYYRCKKTLKLVLKKCFGYNPLRYFMNL